VLNIRDLLDQVTLHKPGEQVQVTLYRGPQEMTLTLEVAQRPRT
jgi:S1-C subfamily serine protease